MIIGLGSDIMDIARMKRELSRTDLDIRRDLFTEHEIMYCTAKRYPERHFAARFAAKEAMVKSLPVEKKAPLRWQDIEIRNTTNGKPYFFFTGELQALIEKLAVRTVLVTLSHTPAWAMATVILES